MKTFGDISIKDTLYAAKDKDTQIIKVVPVNIDSGSILLSLGNNHVSNFRVLQEHFEQTKFAAKSYGSIDHFVFVNKSDAVEYVKSNALDRLEVLKNEALKALQKVYDFRVEFHDQLNFEWIDSEIDKLKRLENTL